MLALLIRNAGNVVTVDSLINGVWGEEASNSVKGSLHTYISNLRVVLGGKIERVGNGYRLEAEPMAVDANLFAQLTDEVQRC